MAEYAILLYSTPETDHDGEVTQADHDAHARELTASGAMVTGRALAGPETATTLRADGVTDGPFLDVKEVLLGFCVIEAPDLDAALDIARGNPLLCQGGALEVRPID